MLMKLQRDFDRLARSRNAWDATDHGLNVAMTAWHLVDWVWAEIKHSPARLANERTEEEQSSWPDKPCHDPEREAGCFNLTGFHFGRVPLHAAHSNLDRRTAFDGLIDHAVALRKLEQLLEPLLSSVGLNVERQPDPSKADRRIFGDPERAAEIEISLGGHHAALQRHIKRRRHRLKGDAGTGDQRFQQHISRTQFEPRAAGSGMEAGDRQGPPGLDLAGNVRSVERALRLERHEGRLRRALVTEVVPLVRTVFPLR